MPRSSGTGPDRVDTVPSLGSRGGPGLPGSWPFDGVGAASGAGGADEAVGGEVVQGRAAAERHREVELGPEVAQHLRDTVGPGDGQAVDVRTPDADGRRAEGEGHESV